MGLKEYKSAMWRFTWKGRFTDDEHGNAVPILATCKDQTGLGGICSYMGCATAMEGQLRKNSIFDEISYEDLAEMVETLRNDPNWLNKPKVKKCFQMVKERGVVTATTKANPPHSQVIGTILGTTKHFQ